MNMSPRQWPHDFSRITMVSFLFLTDLLGRLPYVTKLLTAPETTGERA